MFDHRFSSQVTISPPYLSADVRGKEGQALNHVRKIVDKFHKDEEKRESGSADAGDGSHSGKSLGYLDLV